jgi:4-oxalocrotonate tautomerase
VRVGSRAPRSGSRPGRHDRRRPVHAAPPLLSAGCIPATSRLQSRCPTLNPVAATAAIDETGSSTVPLINVKVIEGVFTDDQKTQIVKSLTEAMVEVEGENMRSVTWVVVEDVKSGSWGIGGQPLTTADVKALAAGAPAA